MFGPLAPPPSSTAGPGDFGEDCLRPQAEFRSRPAWRAAQGTPKGRWMGSPSLVHPFLAKQERCAAAGLPPAIKQRAKRTSNYKYLSSPSFHGATLSSNAIPGKANTVHNIKKVNHPNCSTRNPVEALMNARGTAARLVNRANCVAV